MQDGDSLVDFFSRAGEESGFPDLTEIRSRVGSALQLQQSPVRSVLDITGLPETEFLHSLANQLGVEWFAPSNTLDPQNEHFPARLALRYHLVPITMTKAHITLAGYDPLDIVAISAVRQAFPQHRVQFVASTRKFVVNAIRERYGVGAETFEELLEGRQDLDHLEATEEVNVLDSEDSEASVMKFVNQIMREALNERATDIHVEPLGTDLRIRYRIDGVLHEIPVPQKIKLLQASVLSRIKIMAGLDIAERRIPQDGRINLELSGKPIDVRVATIPSVTGETISLRLLGQERFDFSRSALMKPPRVSFAASSPCPMASSSSPAPRVAASRPAFTPSSPRSIPRSAASSPSRTRGKQAPRRDPDRRAPGDQPHLCQRPAQRAPRRPNVIMVGEMRDLETAEIAVRSALTGHLVFSTLHTNDAVGGITRLMDVGVEPFLISSAVRAFIAQRLVRRLCHECRRPVSPKQWESAGLFVPMVTTFTSPAVARPVAAPVIAAAPRFMRSAS